MVSPFGVRPGDLQGTATFRMTPDEEFATDPSGASVGIVADGRALSLAYWWTHPEDRRRHEGLLHPRDHRTPVGSLSVGQRRRLGLAVAIAAAPDLLLLDEPTNHVSLALAGELEEALATAPGGVVLASHDRWLRRRWVGPELALTPW